MLLLSIFFAISSTFVSATDVSKVAIIGAGAGGSSAAFWISLAKQRSLNPNKPLVIDVYDRNDYIGGRSTIVYPYGNTSYSPIEQGAGIFTDHNKNLMRAVSEFGLQTYQLGSVTGGIGVWDGKEFLYRSSGDYATDGTRMLTRYGTGPAKSDALVKDFLEKFDRSYGPKFPDYQTVSAYSASLNYTSLESITLQSYLDRNGVNPTWTREFQTGSTRFNYAQDASKIQAVAGMTSLSADSSNAVVGGNRKIFQEFLKRSGANVKLNTVVTKIAKAGKMYNVTTSAGLTTTYNAIILAAPAALSGIKFVNIPHKPTAPGVEYVHLHSTLVATTTPAVLPAYFNAKVPPQMPGTIITTGESKSQPEFFGFRYEVELERNGKAEYVVRIFSKAPVSDATLVKWFGKGKFGWVDRKEWDAYPYYPKHAKFPPVILDDGLYYVNSMEGLWSTMETETISSRNCANLVAKGLFGSGICGPSGPKGPKTDSYVLGWDC